MHQFCIRIIVNKSIAPSLDFGSEVIAFFFQSLILFQSFLFDFDLVQFAGLDEEVFSSGAMMHS